MRSSSSSGVDERSGILRLRLPARPRAQAGERAYQLHLLAGQLVDRQYLRRRLRPLPEEIRKGAPAYCIPKVMARGIVAPHLAADRLADGGRHVYRAARGGAGRRPDFKRAPDAQSLRLL